ncbi:MAG TPA: site-specific integrase [Pyrinomonadaceae bacterium]|jgi:integrase
MKIWKEKDPVTKRYKYHANFVCAGKRYRPEADSKDELDDIIDAIKKRARQERYGLEIEHEPITIRQLADERSKDFDKTKRSHRKRLRVIERFVAFMDDPDFPVTNLHQLHLRGFARSLRHENSKLKSSSLNAALSIVGALLRSGERFFPELETWKPPRMPYEALEEKERARPITEEEQAMLLFELRAPLGKVGKKRPRREKAYELRARHTVADLFDFALLTGMRHTEARTLKSSKIDWAVRQHGGMTIYGEVRLTKTKTKRHRTVPLNQDARAILDRRRSEGRSDWIFPNTSESGPISMSSVYRVLSRAAERAGVLYGQRVEDGFVFHDARHTAITNMLQRGADLKTVGSIVGHTDEWMTMHYSHPTSASRAAAISTLKRAANEETLNKK